MPAATSSVPIQNPYFFVETVDKPKAREALDAVKTLPPQPLPIPVRLRGTMQFIPPKRADQLAAYDKERRAGGGAKRPKRPKHTAVPTFAEACRVRMNRSKPIFDRMGGMDGLAQMCKALTDLVGKDRTLKKVMASPIIDEPFLRMVMGGPACYEGPTLREAHAKGRELTLEQVKKLRDHFHTAIQDLSLTGLVVKDLDHLLDALQDDMLPRKQSKEGVTVEQLQALPAQPVQEIEDAPKELEDSPPLELEAPAEELLPGPEEAGPAGPGGETAVTPMAGQAQELAETVQTSLTTALKDSFPTGLPDGGGSSAEMELMRQTIAELQRKLQQTMDEKGQLAADLENMRDMMSPLQQSYHDEDPLGLHASSIATTDGFLVDFEIDPSTMEVRVEVVPPMDGDGRVPLVDVVVAGE